MIQCLGSINRDGNGYSFEVLRGKILYGTPASKKKKFKLKDLHLYSTMNNFFMVDMPMSDDIYTFDKGEYMFSYTDIKELIDIIDKGEF